MTYFATRSSLVLHYAYRCRDLLHRINGPVSTMALHEMRGLYMELGLKIGELEELGHCEQPFAKTVPMSPTSKGRRGVGSASSTRVSTKASASSRTQHGKMQHRTSTAKT